MKRIMMRLPPIEIIHDEPAVLAQHHYSAFVVDRISQPLIPIMFALPKFFIMFKYLSFSPICPRETADHFHLILMVNSDRVMHRATSEAVSPDTFSAI